MFKRIISFGLCLVMFVMLFASCGKTDTTTATNPEDLPATINLIGITDKKTTKEAIEFVEEALNKLSKTRYKTKIELTLVTADEYMAEIEKRVAEADHATIRLAAITKYNALAVKEANNAQKLLSESNDKKNKWTSQVTSVVASTMATGEVYSAEQTTVYEDGKIETVYPSAQSPIDILMIDGKEMYEELEAKGYLLSVKKKLEEKFTKFRQYIYPTFFEQLEAMTGDIKAIPNNNLLADYTYVVIDKTIADAYNNNNGFNIDNVEDYADLEDFLAFVKANYPNVTPLATEPDALGIYQYMEGELAIGTYYDPIYGYDTAEGTDFQVQNLLSIPQYQDHVALMQKYNAAKYIGDGTAEKGTYAVNVIKGDARIEQEYGDDYYVKVVQNPFVQPEAIFDGMFAVSAFTSSEDRALEIIEMFTTDPEAKNIFQYGIADNGDNSDYANYKLVEVEGESGKFVVEITNETYVMDNSLTGNVYMGYPEPGMVFNSWDYFKKTNLDSGVAPFLHLYVEESALDNILTSVLKRAALTDALAEIGIEYDKYAIAMENAGSADRNTYIDAIRKANVSYFVKEIEKTDKKEADKDSSLSKPVQLVTTSDASAVVAEFVKYIQSTEGQEILLKAGYNGVVTGAVSYEKVASLTGEITILANVGTGTKDYFNVLIDSLVEEFQKIYPSVTFVKPTYDPTKGYSDKLNDVNTGTKIGFTYDPNVSGKVVTKVAQSYLDIILNRSHDNFPQMWYENKLVERVTAEQYSNIISALDLQKLVEAKIAELAEAEAVKDTTASAVLANARKKAQNYYTNIAYLRVMVNETLFADDSALAAEYAAKTDAKFMADIFEYVRANYEKENDLTEEEYIKRVQNFMVSVLEYTSKDDSTVRYLVSWDEFIEAEEGAGLYEEAATKIKLAYEEQLKTKLGVTFGILSLDKLMEAVYEIMTDEYLAANGLSKADFKAKIQNKFLSAVKVDAADFNTYKETSDEYKNIVSKLRKKYKAILIEEFSETAYKNGEKGISNEKVVNALYNHFLEEEIGNYDKMADLAGVNVNDYLASEAHYANYAQYISTLKTKYVYTLRTQYKDGEISSWTLKEAKDKIFKILEEKAFYTNELARNIGLGLSEYMLAESDAKAYNDYMKTLAAKLSADIQAKGYNVDLLLEGNGAKLEEIAYEIVEEKFFSDKMSVTDVLKDASAPYMKDYTDAAEMKADAEELSKNAFFNAVVNELQAMWDEKKAELEK